MSKKPLAVILLLIGLVVLVLSVAADTVGLGPNPGFGWKQIVGAVIGVLIALSGVIAGKSRSTP